MKKNSVEESVSILDILTAKTGSSEVLSRDDQIPINTTTRWVKKKAVEIPVPNKALEKRM